MGGSMFREVKTPSKPPELLRNALVFGKASIYPSFPVLVKVLIVSSFS